MGQPAGCPLFQEGIMYKAFSNQLRWMALDSIGTIIGLMIGNVLPLFAVNEGERTFDTIACKQIAILRDDGGISV